MLIKAAHETDHISMKDKMLELNTNYQTMYHLCFDNKVKPQKLVKNYIKEEKDLVQDLQRTTEITE